jgi:hypothetical protein
LEDGWAVAAWLGVAVYRIRASPSALAENLNGLPGRDLVVGGIGFPDVLGWLVAVGQTLGWLRHLRVLVWSLLADNASAFAILRLTAP